MQPDDDKTNIHVPLSSGTVVLQYQIIEKIGAGGMGEVYLAEDTRLKRKVALKFLPTHLMLNEDIKSRFLREAQAVAKLNHPNIVTIYDVSEFNGRPFFAMEHVEGHLLHHFAHEKPLPLDSIIDYAIQVCQGIGEAHRAGVIHRDIKATNIIVDTRGRARLLDFGLAAIAGDDKLTKTGSTLGTVAYMSPEQVSGRDIDQRSDLFSFGIVLYELLAGRTPFRRDSEGATLRAIMEDAPEPLGRYKSGIPDKLQQIIDKLLEKDRQIRYQTAEDIIADLKRLVYDSQPTAQRSPVSKPKSNSKVKWVIAAAMIVILAIGTFVLYPKFASKRAGAPDAVPMIAVLPFENLGSPEDEYFADGMTEEVTSRLAGIQGLRVISRKSAMLYKNSSKTLGEIGEELGVSYILESSVRWDKSGDKARIRITPQLIRVADDTHVWADNYDREMMQVFAVQQDIATRIVAQLGVTLLESNRNTLAARPTDNTKAYDYYLKGINELRKEFQGNMKLASSNLDSAVAEDSLFAVAYAARSRAYSGLAWQDPKGSNANIARKSFEKALQLQPNLAEGHLAAGVYYNFVEEDYDKSLVSFNLAASELRSDAELLLNIAMVQWRKGMISEPNDNFRKASELDPLNPIVHSRRSGFFMHMRMFAEAEQSINRAIALSPENREFYVTKIINYLYGYGDWVRGREVAKEALKSIDTVEFVMQMLPAWTSEQGWSLDSLIEIRGEQLEMLADSMRFERAKSIDSLRLAQSPDLEEILSSDYYSFWVLSELYGAAGNVALKNAYLDSAISVAKIYTKKVPTSFHGASNLGVLLAQSGSCEEAIEWGLRGIEILSIDKCHW